MISTASLRHDDAFDLLETTIKDAVGESDVFYCPSPGNWGDALINFGTDQFFAEVDVSVQVKSREDVLKAVETMAERTLRSTLIVGGGGGWCENWSSTREFVDKCAGSFSKIIILPTTYELPLLSDHTNIIYFSRDLLLTTRKSDILFCHDMAFYINLMIPRQKPQLWRLIALRGDKEKNPNSRSSPAQIDISLLGNSYSSIEPFFEIVNRFRIVYTDRLHVGIAAALLGVDCVIFPGNYDKARLVWKSSMEQQFTHVKFQTWENSTFLK